MTSKNNVLQRLLALSMCQGLPGTRAWALEEVEASPQDAPAVEEPAPADDADSSDLTLEDDSSDLTLEDNTDPAQDTHPAELTPAEDADTVEPDAAEDAGALEPDTPAEEPAQTDALTTTEMTAEVVREEAANGSASNLLEEVSTEMPDVTVSNVTYRYYSVDSSGKLTAHEATKESAKKISSVAQKTMTPENATKPVIVPQRVELGTDGQESWYAVTDNGVEVNARISLHGDVHLILCNGASLKTKCILVEDEVATLTIYAGTTGSEIGTGGLLNCYYPEYAVKDLNRPKEYGGYENHTTCFAAAIGSDQGTKTDNESARKKSGAITIHGGSILASGNYSAGIGGGRYCDAGPITIYGGNVEAKSNSNAAGIGGGEAGNGGTVKIYGGTVKAYCSKWGGAGIGGGEDSKSPAETGGKGGNVYIYGGKVLAYSDNYNHEGIPTTTAIGASHRWNTQNSDQINGKLYLYNGQSLYIKGSNGWDLQVKTTTDGPADVYNYTKRATYMEVRESTITYPKWVQHNGTWEKTDVTKSGTAFTPVTAADTEWNNQTYLLDESIDATAAQITVKGTVDLVLSDLQTLKLKKLVLADDAVLNICARGQGTGTLEVTDEGLSTQSSGAKVYMHGGSATITAKDGSYRPGIQCDQVTVFEGRLRANGSKSERNETDSPIRSYAGIQGLSGDSGTLTVYGGTVIGVAGNKFQNNNHYLFGDGLACKTLVPKTGTIVLGSDTTADESQMSYLVPQNGDYFRLRVMAITKADAPAAHTHTSQQTGGAVSFAACWDLADRLPVQAGSYYLNRDVALEETWTAPSGTVNLCLNGHSITMGSWRKGSVIQVNSGTVLNLYDCTGNPGDIKCDSNSNYMHQTDDQTNT